MLIQQPAIPLGNLVGACSQIFDHNVAEAVDCDLRRLSDAERFLSILDAMRRSGAPVGLPSDLLEHVIFSTLVIALSWDMLEMFNICSGLQTVLTETKQRDVVVAVITGTLRQWRDAIANGCSELQQPTIRAGFNQIHSLFVGHGLGAIWKDFQQRQSSDHQTFFLLE